MKKYEFELCKYGNGYCTCKAKYDVYIDGEHIGKRCWWHKHDK